MRVWIWSIIFGLNTSSLYAFVSGGGFFGGKYSVDISFVILLPSVISGLLLIGSWVLLLRYLNLSILPMIYAEDKSRQDQYSKYEHARLLWLAMLYTILAMAFRFFGSIFSNIFESLSRFS
jgi:hypothetical protein